MSGTTGFLGIGTSTPATALHVAGQVRVGQCMLGNTASAGWSCGSDERLKENIAPVQHALDRILRLRGVEFDWNELSGMAGKHSVGVIAQDVEKVFPTAVTENPATGYRLVSYTSLVAPLIEALRELNQRAEKLGNWVREQGMGLGEARGAGQGRGSAAGRAPAPGRGAAGQRQGAQRAPRGSRAGGPGLRPERGNVVLVTLWQEHIRHIAHPWCGGYDFSCELRIFPPLGPEIAGRNPTPFFNRTDKIC